MSATGGITEGKSHKEGGIPMVVKSTGQHVELEGGEGVINKKNMASTKTYQFQGKKMTACEIASAINSADGNGVQIECDDVVGKKYEYGTGGFVDLFEDYENIPAYVRTMLNEYEEALEDGDIKELKNLQDDLEQVGYTFEFYVDGSSFGLRPINIPLSEIKGYEEFENGGELKMGTETEMEHAETIKKFKRKDISVKEVAKMIAKDHIKEHPKYYSHLKKMEEELQMGIDGEKVHSVLSEHQLLKRRSENNKKFKYGGTVINKEPIHLILTTDFSPSLYNMRTGEYSGDSLIRKNELHHFYMLESDAQSVTLNYPMTDYYFHVPTSIIEVKGKSRKFDVGGSVPMSMGKYDDELSTTDHAILDLLRAVDLNKLTHKDKEFISTFRGDNIINNLPNEYLTMLYSLCFKHHIIQFPIKSIVLKNIGTGNILSLAPTYIKNIFVEFVDNKYRAIEELVNKSQNAGKAEYFKGDYTNIDCVIMVYPHINPEKEELMDLITKTKREMVICGVAEFTSKEKLNEFRKLVTRWTFRNNIYWYLMNEKITEKGKNTLIYVVNSY